jgi:protein-S-isoprenylcysteine O-methyltransferase Ste14
MPTRDLPIVKLNGRWLHEFVGKLEIEMNTTSSTPSSKPSDLTAAIIRRLLQLGVFILIQAAILFGAAGRLNWRAAWAYLAIYLGMIAVNAVVLLPRDPELIAERGQIKADAKGWDKALSLVYAGCALGILAVAGLDVRFKWLPQIARALQWTGVGILMVSWGLASWAMVSNRFFSSVVRIQKDRGHTVVTGGPYRFVRHPGYVGGILSALGAPLLLGSWSAFIPAALLICVIVVRTALEDRTLQDELEGYKDYAGRVRYRLLPGVW